MINSYGRIILLLALFVLMVSLLPFLTGAGMIVSMGEDDAPDEDDLSILNSLPFSWIRVSLSERSLLLAPGISIFTLFVIYLGGRSKHRRFNDRTIEADLVLSVKTISLKTARHKAVFNFLNPSKYRTSKAMNRAFLSSHLCYGGTTS